MSGEKLFLILDIDGVLLESHGYREAYLDCVNHFLRQMGQPDLTIDRRIPDAFESHGINAEWDMAPLTIAAFINWYCEKTGLIPEDDQFPPRCDRVRLNDQDDFYAMLFAYVQELSGFLDPQQLVMDGICHAFLEGKIHRLAKIRELPFSERLLKNSLTTKNPIFADLMNRILGSAVYTDFYSEKAPLDCPSYLVTRDQLLISDHYRSLLPEWNGRAYYASVMTYRPTKLPGSDGNKTGSYFVNTPEGECALELLGWTDDRIPMIGGGSLCFIEEKYGKRREYYVKPHPMHALASMLYALCNDEIEALETARNLCELDPEKNPNPAAGMLSPDDPISLAVFEDSATGVKCTLNAARVLRDWGYNVNTKLCGIMTTAAKNNRLLYAGAALYPNVNAAFDAVLQGHVPAGDELKARN